MDVTETRRERIARSDRAWARYQTTGDLEAWDEAIAMRLLVRVLEQDAATYARLVAAVLSELVRIEYLEGTGNVEPRGILGADA